MYNHSATIVAGSFGGTFGVSRRPWLLLVVGTVLLVAAATPVAAGLITVPTGLNPGDQYRLAFVTSTTRDATSSAISDYNTFVTGVANGEASGLLLALGTTWTAIGSTSAIDARDNTLTNPGVDGSGVPIFLLDGTQLVDDYIDLWDGSIDQPLNITEKGMAGVGTEIVWTGTIFDGTGAPAGLMKRILTTCSGR